MIAVLMSVHNNRNATLETLRSCFRQSDLSKSESASRLAVYLVLDTCTDGTAEAVSEAFPDVRMVQAQGLLSWTKGMNLAWSEASKISPDFFLWLKAGTVMKDDTVSVLVETSTYLRHKAIVAGTSSFLSGGRIVKGGRSRSGRLIAPDKTIPVACDVFDGDLVLIPKYVSDTLGMLDQRFVLKFGDYDYGVRADKAGITAVVAPGILASGDYASGIPKWRDASYPVKERYKAASSPEGCPLKERFLYDLRSVNVFYAVFNHISLQFKILFPKNWINSR